MFAEWQKLKDVLAEKYFLLNVRTDSVIIKLVLEMGQFVPVRQEKKSITNIIFKSMTKKYHPRCGVFVMHDGKISSLTPIIKRQK